MTRIPNIGVYAIENTVTGRVYVGSSIQLLQRMGQHRSNIKSNHFELPKLIKEDLLAHGYESFVFSVLQRTPEASELEDLEILWAQRLDAFGPLGYNRKSIQRVHNVKKVSDEEQLAFDREFIRNDLPDLDDLAVCDHLNAVGLQRPTGGKRWDITTVHMVRNQVAMRRKKRSQQAAAAPAEARS